MFGLRRQEPVACDKERTSQRAGEQIELCGNKPYTFIPAQKAADDLWSHV